MSPRTGRPIELEDKKFIRLALEGKLYQILQEHSEATGVPMSATIRRALKVYLEI